MGFGGIPGNVSQIESERERRYSTERFVISGGGGIGGNCFAAWEWIVIRIRTFSSEGVLALGCSCYTVGGELMITREGFCVFCAA